MPSIPRPNNEPILSYAPASDERTRLIEALASTTATVAEIPLFIGDEERLTRDRTPVVMPHRHEHHLAEAACAGVTDVRDAIDAAMAAREMWAATPYDERARVFLRAAAMIAGPARQRMNATTMLGQSKTVHQSEIDAVCELADFLRFAAHDGDRLREIQPRSSAGVLNEMDLRPLDGFVLAVTPFNFTAIAGNLPAAPALMGNTVVWKPALTQLRAALETMRVFQAAGLPPGVINLVSGDAEMIGTTALASEHLAGVHFTGSTATFQHLYRTVAEHLASYRAYPRIVGETGGKDFIVAHASADRDALVTAIVRGGYEYQGQKCSAVSRVFVAASVWNDIGRRLVDVVNSLEMGEPADLKSFITAVIDEKAYDKIMGYIDIAKRDPVVQVLAGAEGDKSAGYYIRPTLLRVDDPRHQLMTEEIFGPVVCVCVYPDDAFHQTLRECDEATPYALTGAVFATDRTAIQRASRALRFTAGNFYINDKPTGSVVGRQPFGGSRRSGTNDKAGSVFNLMRWASPRVVKETFLPATDHRYPYMAGGAR